MLFHEQHGDGPAVLLVHAGVADSRMWAGIVPRLAEAHRVIACDLRGFGRSPLEPGPYSHGSDLLELLDGLGVDRAAVVAASMGGQVALELALRAPERVTALAQVDHPRRHRLLRRHPATLARTGSSSTPAGHGRRRAARPEHQRRGNAG